MEQIQQILLANQGNRLTPELLQGLYHAIAVEMGNMIEEVRTKVEQELAQAEKAEQAEQPPFVIPADE